MHTRRGMTTVDVRFDAGSFPVTFAEIFDESRSVVLFDEVHGTAPEASASQPGSDAAGLFRSQFDENVAFFATCLEVVTIAGVSLIHEAAKGLHVAGFQRIGGRDGTGVFSNDVSRTFERVGWYLVSPPLQIFDGGIA